MITYKKNTHNLRAHFWCLLLITSPLLITSCQKSLYEIQDNAGYLALDSKNPLTKEILLLQEYGVSAAEIQQLKTEMNKNDYSPLNWTMLEEPMNSFLESISLMRKKEYELAFKKLQLLDDQLYHCQVKVLKIDCEFELGNQSNYQKLYQEAYDCSDNESVKEIIKKRFKHAKYSL